MDNKISQYRHSALKSIQMAKYLLSTTYPMIKEPKTLFSISDHVLSSMMFSVSALLFYERNKRTMPPYHDNDESKINAFRRYLVKKYKFEEFLAVMQRIGNLNKERKKAPIEFSRNGKYVICSDQFSKIETISEQDVKNYIKKAQEFVSKIDGVISNE